MLLIGLFLTSILDILPSPNFTVIYTTTPASREQQRLVPESKAYEMDDSPLLLAHMDLKRDFSTYPRAASNGSIFNNGPLFEKYQFFTPGKNNQMVPQALFQQVLTEPSYIHGTFNGPRTCIDFVCWHLRRSKLTGDVFSIRQGDGSCGAEEAVIIIERFLPSHLHF